MDFSISIKISCLLNRLNLMSRDIAIFYIIIEITNADRGFVSNELLMKKYGKCEKTISSALTNLKKIGLITITIVNGKNFITCNLIDLITY